jgi:hypothetical protein
MTDLHEELKKRVILLQKAKENKQLREVEMELCRRNPMHFFLNYLYTDKNSNLY